MTEAREVPEIHATLLERLTADVRPVRPLRAPTARLVVWLVLALPSIAFAMVIGLRTDTPGMLLHPLAALQVGALVAGATLAAMGALRAAIPGRAGSRGSVRLALVLALLATALLLVQPTRSLADFVANGLRCAFCVGMFGFVPWLALFVLVARGAPFDAPRVGAYVGAAGFLVGAAAVRVACPIEDGVHLVVWHMVPVLLGVGLSAMLGAAVLGRWRRRAVTAR